MKKINEEQICEIIELYKSGMTPTNIGNKFGLTDGGILKILRKRNIPRNQLKRLNEEQKRQIIKRYIDGESSEKIAKNMGLNGTSVCRILKKNGIKIRPATENKRKHHLNKEWLNNIDSEEKAYFLGLLWADGNISRTGYAITISLREYDRNVLIQLSYFFYNENRIKFYDGSAYLSIYSKEITERLAELGCFPNKTHSIKFPEWLDESLYQPFIRGVMDGDGSVSIDKYKKPTVSFTGNYSMIFKLNQIIENELGFSNTVYKSHEEKQSYQITITGQNKIERFIEWIYKNSNIHLKRKYELAKEILFLYNSKEQKLINDKPRDYGTIYIPSFNYNQLTKHYIFSLSIEEKEEIAKFLLKYYRDYGFPFPTYHISTLKKDWNDLLKLNAKDHVEKENGLSSFKDTGLKIFKHFSPHYFGVRQPQKPSMIEAFLDDYKLMAVIKNRLGITLNETFNMTGNMLRQGLRNSYIAYGPSIFKPTFAKYIYEQYCPNNGIVFDFSTGFGQRLLGAMAANNNLTYIACDPWKEAIEGNIKIAKFIKQSSRIKLYQEDSENFNHPEYDGKVDLAFSSPPYYNAEIFCSDETQAYTNGYNYFINDWWKKTLININRLLKTNGYLIFTMKNKIKKHDILNDMVFMAEKTGFNKLNEYKVLQNIKNAKTNEMLIVAQKI